MSYYNGIDSVIYVWLDLKYLVHNFTRKMIGTIDFHIVIQTFTHITLIYNVCTFIHLYYTVLYI